MFFVGKRADKDAWFRPSGHTTCRIIFLENALETGIEAFPYVKGARSLSRFLMRTSKMIAFTCAISDVKMSLSPKLCQSQFIRHRKGQNIVKSQLSSLVSHSGHWQVSSRRPDIHQERSRVKLSDKRQL